MSFECISVRGGWQTKEDKTGQLIGPVFKQCSEAWAWQKENFEEPTPPPGYTAEELERDSPYNQWMYE